MPTKTMTLGAGAFIKSEANGDRSREEVTIATAAGALLAGTVLGKITASSKYAAYDNDASDGTQTVAGILIYDTDATGGDKKAAIIARDAEVWGGRLVWGSAVTTQAEKDAAYVDMAAAGIIVRT